ncbi:MAG: ribosomal-protein-alanine N-acetyltransferase, partial [Candidatus Eremiobacteraeota bacterium]|nr:ribosomal-protein-alanine N-acetyltransferase [Candidatus Eremiobacteraeota bacterium]
MELRPNDASPPDRMEIGAMTPGDIPTVTRIERASFSTVWPSDAFYNELNTNKVA